MQLINYWKKYELHVSQIRSQKLKEELLISYNQQLTLAEERYFESERSRKME